MSCKEVIEIKHGPCREVVELRCGTPGPIGPAGPVGPQGPPGPPGGATGNSILEGEGPITLAAGDITNGYIVVTNPLANVMNSVVQLFGGITLIPNVDYTWVPATSRITFTPTVLSRLVAGDKVFVRRLISVS